MLEAQSWIAELCRAPRLFRSWDYLSSMQPLLRKSRRTIANCLVNCVQRRVYIGDPTVSAAWILKQQTTSSCSFLSCLFHAISAIGRPCYTSCWSSNVTGKSIRRNSKKKHICMRLEISDLCVVSKRSELWRRIRWWYSLKVCVQDNRRMEFIVICQDLTELTLHSTNSPRTRSSAGSSVVPLLLPSPPLRDLSHLPRGTLHCSEMQQGNVARSLGLQ
jgi:hypothetical protein